jgi:hypothetical protein
MPKKLHSKNNYSGHLPFDTAAILNLDQITNHVIYALVMANFTIV